MLSDLFSNIYLVVPFLSLLLRFSTFDLFPYQLQITTRPAYRQRFRVNLLHSSRPAFLSSWAYLFLLFAFGRLHIGSFLSCYLCQCRICHYRSGK